jgi:hypothetical protein
MERKIEWKYVRKYVRKTIRVITDATKNAKDAREEEEM